MGDAPVTGSDLPTCAEWLVAAARGRKAVLSAIHDLAVRFDRHGKDSRLVVPMMLGALCAIAEQVRIMAGEKLESRHTAEVVALAYVRGVMRGHAGPINDDGTDYDG